MLKKFSNKGLLIVLLGLIGVYAVIELTGNKQRSGSLRSTLVEIDTANVTRMNVIGKAGKVELFKENEDWKVKLADSKVVTASESSVKNALSALMSIKPSRMASKSEAKWKDYQVDSTGTRVEVYEGDDKSLDIILGRFGMEGRNAYHTFVRLNEDQEVYAANNFMSFSVGSDANSYRDQTVARIKKDSLTSVTLTYPADSSVQLVYVGQYWNVNGQQADSASVAKYFNGLGYLNSQQFMNDPSGLTIPTITATYSFSNQEDVVIEGYLQDESWVIHSSLNGDGYFTDENLFEKIFKGQSDFLTN